MKKIILLLLIVFTIKMANAQQYVIKANITGFKNGTKFRLENTETNEIIDSVLIKNNQFTLKGKFTEAPLNLWVTAYVGDNFYYFILLMGNETVSVQGDIQDFPRSLHIKGSKTAEINDILNKALAPYYSRRNKIIDEYFSLPKNDSIKKRAIAVETYRIDSAIIITQKNFTKNHMNSYAALDCLFLLKDGLPKETVASMYNSVAEPYRSSRFGKRIATYLKVGKILKKGDMATDFKAIGGDNKLHSLSDIKGKYILLDFSLTYCGPCMEAAAELKNVSQKYIDKLSLISFSGDAGKATWQLGFNRDKPTWLSLWDGKGNASETIIKYGIGGYPSFVLIDPKGQIVSKWVGYDTGEIEREVDAAISKSL